jgi:hypothetical protein
MSCNAAVKKFVENTFLLFQKGKNMSSEKSTNGKSRAGLLIQIVNWCGSKSLDEGTRTGYFFTVNFFHARTQLMYSKYERKYANFG